MISAMKLNIFDNFLASFNDEDIYNVDIKRPNQFLINDILP